MPAIEIHDKSETGGLAFCLRDILPCILPATGHLEWALLEIEATAIDESFDMLSLERQADGSPEGLDVSWSELVSLGERLFQLIDGIVVGFKGGRPSSDATDLRESCEIVIEAIDSSLWRVYAVDESIIACLSRRFDDVRPVDQAEPIPGSHL